MTERKVHPLSGDDTDLARTLQALSAGGGGNNSGGMEARLAKLEARTDGIERRLDDIKDDLRRVESKLLTKWDMAQVVFFVMAALMAAVAFGPRVISLLQP